ncbi:MAG: alpha/beta hydrolase [Oscillospiraceae bacterium]|nr:alpha/beta hydrolase [Oscillospiraceae bacterium]
MKLDAKLTHLPIWGGSGIPGNTGASKSDVMHIDKTLTMEDVFFKYPGIWDKSTDKLGDLRGNDFMVWEQEIRDGYAEETYSDVPQLVCYPVQGSDRAMIICPGGAYLSKSMESEGDEVARFLNAAGISAFVLWYRTYPYRAPLMFLDAQRAVRFVRHHAGEYGIDPGKIGICGFSAGGNLAGVEAFCFRNEPVSFPGYTPDEVDAEDGTPNAVGLIYPAIHLQGDKIVAVMAGREVYEDPAKRDAFADKYDMRLNVRTGDAPVFLCAALDDPVVPPLHVLELTRKCREAGVSCETHLFAFGDHGFGACEPHPPVGPFPQPDFSLTRQWRGLFTTWLNSVFDGKML